MNATIKLPYTPKTIKKLLDAKKAFMEKISSGEAVSVDESMSQYANTEIPEHLRNKYKRKS